MKYNKLIDGEAKCIDLDNQDFYLACCDCGVVHIIQFHHIKKHIWDFAFFRNNRATGQLRRYQYGKLQKKINNNEKKRTLEYNLVRNRE